MSADSVQAYSSVKLEDGMVVIRLPLHRAHSLRVALAECPCRAPKATATADIRKSLSAAIGKLGIATR